MPYVARTVFVVLFVIQCLTWYGTVESRIDNNALVAKECKPITIPTAEQCAHVLKSCVRSDTILSIQYLQHYFCASSLTVRPFIFAGLLVWLAFLFSTLGISASDFFTPNLATISQLLHLDENVAGVTLLAFGNGSPDVFSTFSAMKADSASLAIGELLGAATFITSVVVGSMCIIKPFKVMRGPFIRDVGFFTVAVGLLLGILWDGQILAWEAGVLVSLYVIYAVTVVGGSWWMRRKMRRNAVERMARAEYRDDEEEEDVPNVFSEPYRDDPSSTPTPTSPSRSRAISAPAPPRLQTSFSRNSTMRRTRSRSPSPPPSLSKLPSFSLVGALEFRSVVESLRRESRASSLSVFDTPVTPYAGGHYSYYSIGRTSRSRSRVTSGVEWPPTEINVDPWDRALAESRTEDLPMHDRTPPDLMSSSRVLSDEPEDAGRLDVPPQPSIPTLVHTPPTPSATALLPGDTATSTTQTRLTLLTILRKTWRILFPSLISFRTKSFLGQIASLFAAPAILLLTLTLPVVVTPYEPGQRHHEKSRSETPGAPLPTGDSTHRLVEFEEEDEERVLAAEYIVENEMHGGGDDDDEDGGVKFNRWLMAAQCIAGPCFAVAVLFNGVPKLLYLLLAALIAGLAVGILVVTSATEENSNHPTFRMIRCSLGFCVAIVWIMAIADEVVSVLQTFGFIFGLSDAIIGLTIFAVGNSLADLVANMTVAVFAPIMGFSACFGGPMLNILLGIGLSSAYVLSHSSPSSLLYATPAIELHFGSTLLTSSIGLLTILFATLVIVPLNGFRLERWWGITLIAGYAVIMGINIWVELRVGRSKK